VVVEYGLKVNPNLALETAAAQLLASVDRKAALDSGYRWRLLGVVNLFNFSFTELGVRSHERLNVVYRISMSEDFIVTFPLVALAKIAKTFETKGFKSA
jgi:hypothetical protein